MSEENVEALEHLYDQWTAGDWTDASLFDPYAVAVLPDPTPQPHYGIEALAAYTRRFLEPWEDIKIEVSGYRDAENVVVASIRLIGKGRSSGAETDYQATHVWTFRGKHVVRFEVFESEAEALEAAGLTE